jgi:mRNA (guanine-N7-)-methyltransferase
MHYAFETEKKVRQMLSNISASLRPGGVFLGTTLSAHKVLYVGSSVGERSIARLTIWTASLSELLEYIPADAPEFKVGNPYYSITFEKRKHEGIYGQAYSFSLVDAIEDCTEWVVHWEPFVE